MVRGRKAPISCRAPCRALASDSATIARFVRRTSEWNSGVMRAIRKSAHPGGLGAPSRAADRVGLDGAAVSYDRPAPVPLGIRLLVAQSAKRQELVDCDFQ